MNASEKAAANRAKRNYVHISWAEKRKGLPEFDQTGKCPKCGGNTETGFGLAGGGFGVYTYCDPCGIITSKSVCDE